LTRLHLVDHFIETTAMPLLLVTGGCRFAFPQDKEGICTAVLTEAQFC
jgi:hypothetical protein